MDVNRASMMDVFDKLNDLKSLFKFGERLIPIIQSLIEFMKEIVPLLENINSSIFDTTSKMPQATNQINNVTNATELATNEILDLVDKISNIVTDSEKFLRSYIEEDVVHAETIEKLKTLLQGNEEALSLLQTLTLPYRREELKTKVLDVLSSVRDDSYQITLSLQVQDITAQQLAAVNHLIQSVHSKLSGLISDIDHSNIKSDIELEMPTVEGATFDPKASYTGGADRQMQADEIISAQNKQASQEEIDKLFR